MSPLPIHILATCEELYQLFNWNASLTPRFSLLQVFVYHKEFPMPVLAYKFTVADPISGQEIDDPAQFISCVCWRGQSTTLLSANSSGNIKILEMDWLCTTGLRICPVSGRKDWLLTEGVTLWLSSKFLHLDSEMPTSCQSGNLIQVAELGR